jgi:hypothetical protein
MGSSPSDSSGEIPRLRVNREGHNRDGHNRELDRVWEQLERYDARIDSLEHRHAFILGVVACVSFVGSVLSFLAGFLWR